MHYCLRLHANSTLPLYTSGMAKILIVEDEEDIRELLQTYLQYAGHEVRTAADGAEALAVFEATDADLIMLDILLPFMDGYQVCERIRRVSDVPIIMLTALDNEANELRGFDLRIDDYIAKPFSMPLLLRRIDAVLRRAGKGSTASGIAYGRLFLDAGAHKVTVDEAGVDLTYREFELLKTLLENRGRVLTRQTLLNRVWEQDFYGDERIVDTHIKNLRRKLNVPYIDTVRGVGYRINRNPPE